MIVLEIIIKDKIYCIEELKHRINQSLGECLSQWTLKECLHENPYIKEE